MYWQSKWPDAACALRLGGGDPCRLPCIAVYSRHRHACDGDEEFGESRYFTIPLGACTIELRCEGGEPRFGRKPPKCATAGWRGDLPPWVWSFVDGEAAEGQQGQEQQRYCRRQQEARQHAMHAETQAGSSVAGNSSCWGGRGRGGMRPGDGSSSIPTTSIEDAAGASSGSGSGGSSGGNVAAVNGGNGGGGGGSVVRSSGTAPPAGLSAHVSNGLKALLDRLPPAKEDRAQLGAVTKAVHDVFNGGALSSAEWSCGGVVKGGSAEKGTHLAGRWDIDLLVWVRCGAGMFDRARKECLAFAFQELTGAGWEQMQTRPCRHQRFQKRVQQEGPATDGAGATAAASAASAASGGSTGTPPYMHVDIVPVPVPSGAPDQRWETLHRRLLEPLLSAAASKHPPRPDEARTLQVTLVEVTCVRRQAAPVRAVMRLLKAWVRRGGHGVEGAEAVSGTVCEVAVMAACRPEHLVDPRVKDGRPPPPVPDPLVLFLDTLGLVRDRLVASNKDPVMAPMLYTQEQAEGCRESWLPLKPPYTPVILHPADPTANLNERGKFSKWDALAAAAGRLREELATAECGSSEEWWRLVRRTSLRGVAEAFCPEHVEDD